MSGSHTIIIENAIIGKEICKHCECISTLNSIC